MRQLESQGFFQDHQVDALAHQRPQQRLAGGDATLCAGNQNHHPRLGSDEQKHGVSLGVTSLLMLADRGDHTIDDQLANPGNGRRQHPGHQGQHGKGQRHTPAGRPDQLKGAAAVAEYVEKPLGLLAVVCI